MQHSYGFHYTSDDAGFLFKLVSIGHGLVNDESYRWNGLERGGGGVVFQYTVRGTGMLRQGRDIRPVPKGHAFAVSIPGDHEYYYDASHSPEDWEFLWIRFELSGEEGLTAEKIGLGDALPEIGGDSPAVRLLRALYEDTAAKRVGDRFDCSLRIYEWLVALQRSIRHKDAGRTFETPEAYRRTAEHIDRHFDRELTLDQLASVAGLNKYHLCKKFPQFYAVTPMDYVRNRRLELAAELLRGSALAVSEIAARCGFSNVSYFGKVFRKVIGMPPTAYREAGEDRAQRYLRLME